jgi:hypothetical protein
MLRRPWNLLSLLCLLGCNGTVSTPRTDIDDVEGDGADESVDSDGDEDEAPSGDEGAVDPDDADDDTPGDPDAGGPADPCPRGTDAQLDVVSASVTGPNGATPLKGDELTVTLTVRNQGSQGTDAVLTVRIDSQRFDRFVDIPLGTSSSTLVCPGESTLTLRGGPFLSDDADAHHFALGTGDYTIARVEVEHDGQASTDSELAGRDFSLATSNALLVPLLYHQGYFDEIQGGPWESPEAYATEAFTRFSEVFTPTSGDPDGPGDYVAYEGGYDEMMGVRHLFRSFPGYDGTFDSGENWLYGAMDYASQVLGLPQRWGGGGTRDDQHGFDYVVALTSKMGGGIAWYPFDIQVSGFINRDLDRQQVILVHESAHVFGSPHCDDVGNGSGGPLQGYVMCSGEKHDRYPGSFVYHRTSRDTMSASRWK